TYTAATGTLTKDAGDGSGAQTLATGISGLTFGYFDTLADAPIAAPVAAASLPLIGRIQIQTTTLSAQAASGRSTYQINTNVRPRNLEGVRTMNGRHTAQPIESPERSA